jgi:hypothetical protein
MITGHQRLSAVRRAAKNMLSRGGETQLADLPGKELAEELLQQSRAEVRRTPIEAVVQAANEGKLDDDARFRLIGPLWTLERLFYYASPTFGMKILLHSLLASGAVPSVWRGAGTEFP